MSNQNQNASNKTQTHLIGTDHLALSHVPPHLPKEGVRQYIFSQHTLSKHIGPDRRDLRGRARLFFLHAWPHLLEAEAPIECTVNRHARLFYVRRLYAPGLRCG